MGCGCKDGLFTPPGVAPPPSNPGAARNRMSALVGGAPARRWNGPLRPAKQPPAK